MIPPVDVPPMTSKEWHRRRLAGSRARLQDVLNAFNQPEGYEAEDAAAIERGIRFGPGPNKVLVAGLDQSPP
jgi:hypothetical protein